ncbi:MAG: hypothetical protein AB2813_13535 [Candidatus Sedimenticola endophacoides]
MSTVNGVDFDEVIDQALLAARAVVTENWDQLEDIVAHIGEGLVSDVAFIVKKKKSGEFQVCRYLVKDFGTSKSPKSTRQRDSRYFPDRPALITTPSRTLLQSCSCATPS